MSDEITTWGKFETRSVVRPPIPLALNYDPELAKEMEEYTWGKFETRSIVRPKLHVNMHAVRPYLKMTLGLNEDAKLTYDQAMDLGQRMIAAVMAVAPQLQLQYSAEYSKVEDGKLIAAMMPQYDGEDVEELLNELVEQLRNRPWFQEPDNVTPTVLRTTAKPEFLLDFATVTS